MIWLSCSLLFIYFGSAKIMDINTFAYKYLITYKITFLIEIASTIISMYFSFFVSREGLFNILILSLNYSSKFCDNFYN